MVCLKPFYDLPIKIKLSLISISLGFHLISLEGTSELDSQTLRVDCSWDSTLYCLFQIGSEEGRTLRHPLLLKKGAFHWWYDILHICQKATLAFTVMLRLVSPSHCYVYKHYLLSDVDWRNEYSCTQLDSPIYETRASSCDTYRATSRHPVYPTFRVRELHGSSTRHSASTALHSELQPSRRTHTGIFIGRYSDCTDASESYGLGAAGFGGPCPGA